MARDGRTAGILDRCIDWLEQRLNLTEIFSALSIYGLFYSEIDTRKPLRQALRDALDRPLPSYARWPRVLGLLVVVLFVFEGLTGGLLALYYRPTAEAAHASVRTIVRDVQFGWSVHQIHRWGAQLLLAVLVLRLLRFFYGGLHRPPRELLWLVAGALFLAGTHLELSGRLLTWNSLSYWSTTRGLEVLFDVPVAGDLLALFVGGREVGDPTLLRFYVLHVLVLPLAFLGLLYLNFATVRRVGLSPEGGEPAGAGREQYRAHAYNLGILITLIFAVLVTLAVLLPAPFSSEVDLFATPAGVRPPWYLLGAYGFLEIFPAWVPRRLSATLLTALLALVAALPFLERAPAEAGRRSRRVWILGTALFVLWALFTLYGALLDLPGGGTP